MLFVFSSTIAHSDDRVICSGKSSGLYHKVGKAFSTFNLRVSGNILRNKNTDGSADNIVQLDAGLCDFAIIQVDAAFSAYADGDSGINLKPKLLDYIVDSLYLEPIHFLVRSEDRFKNIEQILDGGRIHGWRAKSGHYSSAIYLCSDKLGNSRCDGWPIHEIEEIQNKNDDELVGILEDRLLKYKDIDAIVFTAGAGHRIMKVLVNTPGINLIDTKEFQYSKYPFYRHYSIEAGTYIKGNIGKPNRYASTFATLAVLVANENIPCREILQLRAHLKFIRKNVHGVGIKWISVLDQPDDVVKVRECNP
jgi:TRAP-type uncharacterized transport system substrate-binding protein